MAGKQYTEVNCELTIYFIVCSADSQFRLSSYFDQLSKASVSRKEAFYKLRLFIDFARSWSKSNYWLRATIWPRDCAQYGVRSNCAEPAADWLIKTSAFEGFHTAFVSQYGWQTIFKSQLWAYNLFYCLLSRFSISIVIVFHQLS